MKVLLFKSVLLLILLYSNNNAHKNIAPAFPGAEGFGKYTTGGRGGDVYIVSTLDDNGPGSLREALEAKGKRTVVFSVSGNIELESRLLVKNGDLTVAGQSAPGDGITIRNHPLILNSNNIIVRYIRVRVGDKSKREYDAFSGTKMKDIIIDHCSISWGNDEVASFYDNENFTMQWCIISEALHNSYHSSGGAHGYGGIFGGMKATFHHNLMAHHFARLPRFNGARYHKQPEKEIVDFRNNVLYNWVNYTSHGGEEGNHSIINNYYKHGPATQKEHRYRMLRTMQPAGKFYISGNHIYGDKDGSRDNWLGGNWKGPIRGESLANARADKPFPLSEVTQDSAEEAFEKVLASAGASFRRDSIDKRIVEEVRTGTATFGKNGIIDSQNDVGGWPILESKPAPKDTDQDGIPDEWEIKNGLDPNNPNDSKNIQPGTFYTYLEIYLEELLSEKGNNINKTKPNVSIQNIIDWLLEFFRKR